MSETNGKGITIRARDLGIVLTFAAIIVGSIVDSALTRATVDSHESVLKQYPPAVIYTTQRVLVEDVKEMKSDMKEVLKLVTEFVQ